MPALVARRYKRAVIGAVAIGSVAAACYYHQTARQKRKRSHDGDVSTEGATSSASKASKSSKSSKSSKRGSTKRYSIKALVGTLLGIVGRDKLVALLALTVSKTLLSNRLAHLQGYLFRAAFLRRVPLFVRNVTENVALCGLAAVLEATIKAAVSNIELSWRTHLTSDIHEQYFGNMMYYKMAYVDRRVEHAEHIICEDVPMLTSGLAELLQELLTACVDAAWYSIQLKRYWDAWIYAGGDGIRDRGGDVYDGGGAQFWRAVQDQAASGELLPKHAVSAHAE